VERRYLKPDSVQNRIGRVTFRELVENYRKKSFSKLAITTQPISAHILDHYLLPRWGDSFALDVEPDHIGEWLAALVLANPMKEKSRRVMNVVYRRGQKSRILPMTGDGNPWHSSLHLQSPLTRRLSSVPNRPSASWWN
jgi:hypothetical protein